MTAIAVREVELLARQDLASEELSHDVWALLRCGGVPVGYAHLRPRRSKWARVSVGEAVAAALTPAHAANALRVAVDAWVRRAGSLSQFSVSATFDALRAASADSDDGDADAHAVRMSVAICSRDRPHQLARAVSAIVGTLRPTDELLVILNAPSSADASFDRQRFPGVRVVVEPRPGLSWARNRAIAEFGGDVLLFTDDDCVPGVRWVAAHRSLFARNPDVDVMTGLVEPLSLETPAQRLFEAYGGFPRHYARRWIHASESGRCAPQIGDLGVGANLGVRRRAFEQIGPFDAALGPGTECGAGDDVEFLFRALKCGLLLACEPRAVVRHEHRNDLDGLRAQIGGWSRGFFCAMWRSTLAFPEERRAFAAYRRRVAVHHARRAVVSPRLRELALVELKEMRASGRRYAAARADALAVKATHVSPAQDMLAAPTRPARTHPTTDAYQKGLRMYHGTIGADRVSDSKSDELIGRVTDGDRSSTVLASLEYLRGL